MYVVFGFLFQSFLLDHSHFSKINLDLKILNSYIEIYLIRVINCFALDIIWYKE